MMLCGQCGKTIDLSPDDKLPPWCRGCGAELKSAAVALALEEGDPLPVLSAHAAAAPSFVNSEEWKERFSKHNLMVGILLFVWGLVVSAGPPQNGGDKVLRSYERLGTLIDTVQAVTLINGAALVASGMALKRRWRWGYPLAVGCGIVQVMAGFIFLAGYQSMPTGPYLEHGVARMTFIRQNLDMLIGLVDGLGLLWFISTRVPRSNPATEN